MKKQILHFVAKKLDRINAGYPVCSCYHDEYGKLVALDDEFTTNKKKVTCKNCKRTKLFRGVK